MSNEERRAVAQYELNTLLKIMHHHLQRDKRQFLYGVPRGGKVVVALLIAKYPGHYDEVDSAKDAEAIIDDIIDSGTTKERYRQQYTQIPFYSLTQRVGAYVVFPWEQGEDSGDLATTFQRLLQQSYITGLPEEVAISTPIRAQKAWLAITAGMHTKRPKMTVFPLKDNSNRDSVVIERIPFHSICEHHLLPFFGTAEIRYVPERKILGMSKFPRIVKWCAQRITMQEALTKRIAEEIYAAASPLHVSVKTKARHMCAEMRGVEIQTHTTCSASVGKND